MEDETEIPQEQTPLARAEEAENTAEIAIALADDANARITQCEAQIEALIERINVLESEHSNVRTDDGISDGSTDDNQAETGATSEEPVRIIEPNREHPYFRKLW